MAATSTMAALTGPGSVTLHGQDSSHEPVIVCVGVDRILRSVKTTQSCGEGEKRYALSEAKSELEDPKVVDTGEPKGVKHPSEARVSTLEEEVRQLQRELNKSNDFIFKAPFIISGKSGEPIFIVQETEAGPSAEVQLKGTPIVQFGIGPKGNPAVRILGPLGERAVALGLAAQGFGALQLYDGTTDSPKAWIYGGGTSGPVVGVSKDGTTAAAALTIGRDGEASLEIKNTKGVGVISLHPGTSGGGVLQLGDAAGNTMVEAGVAGGVGQVRAYPTGNPGAGLLGMPGTFISGRKR